MLANADVQEALKEFFMVSTDPMAPASRESLEFMTSNYVPEMVVLSPAGEFVQAVDLERVASLAGFVDHLNTLQTKAVP